MSKISLLLHFVAIVSCLALLIQDLKYRKVHVVLILFWSGSLGVINYLNGEWRWVDGLTNTLGLLSIACITSFLLYFSRKVKNRKMTTLIGTGDIILWLFAAWTFTNLQYYLLAIVVSALVSILLAIVFTQKSIPFAGYSAFISTCIYVLIEFQIINE